MLVMSAEASRFHVKHPSYLRLRGETPQTCDEINDHNFLTEPVLSAVSACLRWRPPGRLALSHSAYAPTAAAMISTLAPAFNRASVIASSRPWDIYEPPRGRYHPRCARVGAGGQRRR